MIWGRPTWGVYWTWDARLTTSSLLFLLYLGYLAVRRLPADVEVRNRRSAFVALLAFVDVPIVYLLGDWWRSLHQEATLSLNTTITGLMLFTLMLGIVVSLMASLWLLDPPLPGGVARGRGRASPGSTLAIARAPRRGVDVRGRRRDERVGLRDRRATCSCSWCCSRTRCTCWSRDARCRSRCRRRTVDGCDGSDVGLRLDAGRRAGAGPHAPHPANRAPRGKRGASPACTSCSCSSSRPSASSSSRASTTPRSTTATPTKRSRDKASLGTQRFRVQGTVQDDVAKAGDEVDFTIAVQRRRPSPSTTTAAIRPSCSKPASRSCSKATGTRAARSSTATRILDQALGGVQGTEPRPRADRTLRRRDERCARLRRDHPRFRRVARRHRHARRRAVAPPRRAARRRPHLRVAGRRSARCSRSCRDGASAAHHTTSRSRSSPTTASKHTPFPFNVATLWSALEGSILLWATVLAGYLVAIALKFRNRATDPLVGWAMLTMFVVTLFFFGLMLRTSARPTRSRHVVRRSRRASTGPGPTRCCRTTSSWRSTRRCSTSATSASRCRSRSPSPRSSPAASARAGWSRPGGGRCSRGASSRSASCSARGGATRCSAGAATGRGTRSRTRRSCRGSPAPRTCTR